MNIKRRILKYLTICVIITLLFLPTITVKLGYAQEIDIEGKIYSNATIEDNFDDSSIIVMLFPEYSKFRGIKEEVRKEFSSIDIKEIRELSALDDRHLNSDGTISKQKAPGLASHYKKIEYKQFLCVELENGGKQNVLDAIQKVEKFKSVHYVGPNYISASCSEVIALNDTEINRLWGLTETDGINVNGAWQTTKGLASIRVGVIDSGIATHDDLEDKVDTNLSEVYGEMENPYDDIDGHGTKVAGIIAAIANNNMGIAGVAPNITLVSLNTGRINNVNNEIGHSSDDRISAINYAIRLWDTENRISILNHSIEGFATENECQLIEYIKQFPGLFVWSADNRGKEVSSTIAIKDKNSGQEREYNFNQPNIISVGAINKEGNRSNWSDQKSSCYGEGVNIYAPGGGRLSGNIDVGNLNSELDKMYIISTDNSNGYSYFNGTSAAAPHVSGVAALMLSKNPTLSAAEIKEIILKNEDSITIEGLSSKKLNATAVTTYCRYVSGL